MSVTGFQDFNRQTTYTPLSLPEPSFHLVLGTVPAPGLARSRELDDPP